METIEQPIDTWNIQRTAEQLGKFVARLDDDRLAEVEL